MSVRAPGRVVRRGCLRPSMLTLEPITRSSRRRAHRHLPLQRAHALFAFADDGASLAATKAAAQNARRKSGSRFRVMGSGVRASAVAWPPARDASRRRFGSRVWSANR
jgi:hypothetical protein